MPKTYNLYNNSTLLLLIQKGYKTTEIAKMLGITYNRLRLTFTRPVDHLNLKQIIILSTMLGLPLFEVISLLMGKTYESSKDDSNKWYDNNKE